MNGFELPFEVEVAPWLVPWLLATAVLLVGGSVVAFAVWPRKRAARPVKDPALAPASPEPFEVAGDVTFAGLAEFPRGLRVRGSLLLREDARVVGDLDVDGDVIVSARAEIAGALSTRGALELASGARTRDARVAGDAVLARDAVVAGRLTCDRLVIAGPRVEHAQAKLVKAASPSSSGA